MNKQEKRTAFSLAGIYAFRMLGLFMILPIFSLYAEHFHHADLTLIGLALGIYGLTQAILQIPFGMASDRIGRKPVIIIGLLLFAIGSVIAAESHSIYGIIIGRALQGAGAIGSTLTAFVADNVDDENRLKAMSIIGMTIGLSFIIAMILGPILNSLIGLSGIFWLTAVLAIIGIIMITCIVPAQRKHILHRDAEAVPTHFSKILTMPELLRLDFGIFALHAMLTALFIVIPLLLTHSTGLQPDQQWMLYLPVLILAFIAMVPFIIIAEAKRRMKTIFCGAVILVTSMQFLLWHWHHSIILMAIILFVFFTAFTLLEASLPSLVAKIAPAGRKGTAMGIYSSSQFLGIFVGGTIGGLIFRYFGITSVFLFCGIIGLIWVLLAITMKKPQHLSSKILSIGPVTDEKVAVLKQKLLSISGVADVMICPDEQVAYLKVDKKILAEAELNQTIR